MRSHDDLARAEAELRIAVAAMTKTQPKVALAYSGGAESGLLLHLLRPFRDRVAVGWADPGVLPHDRAHVLRETSAWPGFVHIPVDRAAAWRTNGLPSPIVPTAHDPMAASDKAMPSPPITSMAACCARLRWGAVLAWCRSSGVSLLIHGQRHGEGSGLFAGASAAGTWSPLATWTRDEVMARVEWHGIALPMQYAEGYAESAECAGCPAYLAPARMAFLRRRPSDCRRRKRMDGALPLAASPVPCRVAPR